MTLHADTIDRLGLTPEVRFGLGAYVSALNAAVDREWERAGDTHSRPTFRVDPAARRGRFLRVVRIGSNGRNQSVHAFVEQATGNVIKPAGWKAPAKSIARGHEGELLSKYNLATGLTTLLDRLRSDSGCIYGGYLYQ